MHVFCALLHIRIRVDGHHLHLLGIDMADTLLRLLCLLVAGRWLRLNVLIGIAADQDLMRGETFLDPVVI